MPEEKEQINFFAKTNFRNKEQPFGIKVDDRRRHFYTLGKTGMGKTSLIQNMAIQDIQNGNGVAIVDPHGEFAEECMKAVPQERIKDVIYFNPGDLKFPVSLNIMENVDPEYRHLVSSGLIGIFKKLWADSWGPRLEYILRNAILALLCHPSATLLGVNRILVDKQYREEVLSYVDDPVVSAFWIDEFSRYNDKMLVEAISPIQNKVGQFLSSGLIRNIVGQPKSSFNIREAMDEGKILIMNLSKGHIGEDSSALLGAMMVTKIQLAAMSRVNIEESERRDFYLYVDEFQNFATDSFAGILSEARKYRLNLILAHQFMAQLEETVLNAVLGNVGTIATFRVGALDTDILEKEFDPVFFASDLVNLDKYNIYLKLMIDGVSTRPFSAATLLPINISSTAKNVDKVIETSRARYAQKREDVEEAIMNWSGMKNPETVQNIKAFAKQGTGGGQSAQVKKQAPQVAKKSTYKQQDRKSSPQKVQQIKPRPNSANNELGIGGLTSSRKVENFTKDLPKNDKKSDYKKNVRKEDKVSRPSDSKVEIKSDKEVEDREVTIISCSGCGNDTEVNFVPDGVRPVFCQDCLKDYRREQSKIQQAKIDSGEQASTQPESSRRVITPRASVATDVKQGSNKKYNKITKSSSSSNVRVVREKKPAARTRVDSGAVQNLIKDAMNK